MSPSSQRPSDAADRVEVVMLTIEHVILGPKTIAKLAPIVRAASDPPSLSEFETVPAPGPLSHMLTPNERKN